MNSAIKKDYQGCLLAASPANPKDNFGQSVILLTSYNDEVATGIQINYPYTMIKLENVINSMGIPWETDDELWFGGVHSPSRVHIIHTTDWMGYNTTEISDDLAVTNDISVLTALSTGDGPTMYRACAGYYVWQAEDLEVQLSRPSKEGKRSKYQWEVVPATLDLIFDHRGTEQWRQVLAESIRYQVSQYF
jgi:putative AlgH/UPF0301 family transcriptional regulator